MGFGLFYLNTEDMPRGIDHYPSQATVLEYLRLKGLLGTKEGCATGDCGSCTAAVVSLEEGKLSYRSLNTCITPLSSLHGRLLITVDGLAESDGTLHPVQQSMVDKHGSQCGFCTPGFVMSLFTHVKNGAKKDREEVIEGISGNLCRCTGYLPIIRAGQSLSQADAKDVYAKSAALIKQRLSKLQKEKCESSPTTVAELSKSLLSRSAPRIVAGSTDLGLEITQSLAKPRLVNVRGIKALRGIKQTAKLWKIGAATPWEQCAKELSPHLPGFGELMRRFGSPQIRAQATVGGNIGTASPIADGPPVFLALGCKLVLQRGAMKRVVDLEGYYTGYRQTVLRPGEFIHSIILKRPPAKSHFNVYKVSKRVEDDISSVCGAYLLTLDSSGKVSDVRIAYGGMAATPLRAANCEKMLIGEAWNQRNLDDARKALARDYKPLNDLRASANYRALVAGNLLQRFADQVNGTHVELAQVEARA